MDGGMNMMMNCWILPKYIPMGSMNINSTLGGVCGERTTLHVQVATILRIILIYSLIQFTPFTLFQISHCHNWIYSDFIGTTTKGRSLTWALQITSREGHSAAQTDGKRVKVRRRSRGTGNGPLDSTGRPTPTSLPAEKMQSMPLVPCSGLHPPRRLVQSLLPFQSICRTCQNHFEADTRAFLIARVPFGLRVLWPTLPI
mmetsp:Transcript_11975/g.15141  ORF Transcript_11975/g.15141 Transcript_11975/m.15141 type:complete len:200 (+) Transcript_11975:522-1121(+)